MIAISRVIACGFLYPLRENFHLFIQPLVDTYVAYVYFGAVRMNAAGSTLVHACVLGCACVSFWVRNLCGCCSFSFIPEDATLSPEPVFQLVLPQQG